MIEDAMGPSTEHSSQIVPRNQRQDTMSTLSSSSSSSSSPSLRSLHSSPDHHAAAPIPSFGIPFSWEHLPGIPKKQTPSSWSSKDKQVDLLPLPPSNSPTPTKSRSFDLRKKSIVGRCQRDPFIAALLECSKDDDASCRAPGGGFSWIIGARLSRSLSDRLGLPNIAYTASCKRSCTVSQSIIRLPGTGGVQ